MKTLVIGLGNSVLTDDAVGLVVMRGVEAATYDPDIEFIEMGAGGIRLLDVIPGYDRVVLIDAVLTRSVAPGTLFEVALTDTGETYVPSDASGGAGLLAQLITHSPRLASAHDADLQTTLDLARTMGAQMPHEILIFGIEADDVMHFSEELTPAVATAVEPAVKCVMAKLAGS
jgi:hydrogenase maturation protease